MIELNSQDHRIIQISENPLWYLSETDLGSSPLIELMEKEGWTFYEQMGAGYIFFKDSNKIIITSVQYTGKYRLWKFPN